jgi:hypothetical protein
MTKSIFIALIGGLLAFIAGIVTAASWDAPKSPPKRVEPAKVEIKTPPSQSVTIEPSKTEIRLADGHSRIVADEVRLKSEQLRYKVELRYPQIVDSHDLHIKKLNQRIKRFAIDSYQWLLTPSKKDLLHYKRTFPAAYNFVDLDYEVVLASDSYLSIYFKAFHYGIGAAHSVQISDVINYDLKSHRELKLTDLFKSNSKYLEFIIHYCTTEMSQLEPLIEPLAPKTETFESWNITENGIRFNFDACKVTGCADGAQEVTIPFSALRPFLKKAEMF